MTTINTATSPSPPPPTNNSTLRVQLESLQDADTYATAWQAACQAAVRDGHTVKWGGRGSGGRGRARRTWQPRTIVVEPLSLSYIRTAEGAPAKPLLDETVWRVHPAHVYAILARNGAGKSSLLQHMHNKTLTGFPPHVSTLLIAQQQQDKERELGLTVKEYMCSVFSNFQRQSALAQECAIHNLEAAMDALDLETTQGQEEMESLSQQLATLDEASAAEMDLLEKDWHQALDFMGLEPTAEFTLQSLHQLSPGQRQKVRLATVLICPCQLVLLDEPSQQLDIPGLWRLRRLIHVCQSERQSTVVLASHDVDLINDVATDVIEWRKQKLHYYTGNFHDYEVQRKQETTQHQRQIATVTRKKQAAQETLQHLKEQNPSRRRGGAKKKANQLSAQRQKMNRITADEQAAQAQLDDDKEHGPLEKLIQFVFRNPPSQWNEPLILAYGLGHGYGDIDPNQDKESPIVQAGGQIVIRKKDGFLFDHVDLCIEEGGTYAIVGPSSAGKTTLLRLLAGLEKPTEGEVKYALNVDATYVSDNLPDEDQDATTLAYLMRHFPQKTEQEIRGEMANFGLGPCLATTRLAFLSGGERARLQLTTLMLDEPDVLLWDDPSAHLDPASVQALIKGLKEWKGTLVMVSHDSFFLRELEATCWALVPEEGKLRRVEGGVDVYLQSYAKELNDI